jgi:hypothetical protein
MSTITKWNRVHSSRTVSLKSLVPGLSKLKTTRLEAEVAQFLSQPAFSEADQQERALFPMVSMTSRIFSLWSRKMNRATRCCRR